MQKKLKNYLIKKSKDMTTLGVLLFGGLLLWILADGRTPPPQDHIPVATAVHAAHVINKVDTGSFVEDSLTLVNRFKRIERHIKACTATIERLREDSAHLEAEADSLFTEVMAGN